MYLAVGARYMKRRKLRFDLLRCGSEIHEKKEVAIRCTSLVERDTSKEENSGLMYLAVGARYIKRRKW
jgi:hypothetical protein